MTNLSQVLSCPIRIWPVYAFFWCPFLSSILSSIFLRFTLFRKISKASRKGWPIKVLQSGTCLKPKLSWRFGHHSGYSGRVGRLSNHNTRLCSMFSQTVHVLIEHLIKQIYKEFLLCRIWSFKKSKDLRLTRLEHSAKYMVHYQTNSLLPGNFRDPFELRRTKFVPLFHLILRFSFLTQEPEA